MYERFRNGGEGCLVDRGGWDLSIAVELSRNPYQSCSDRGHDIWIEGMVNRDALERRNSAYHGDMPLTALLPIVRIF